MISLKLNQIQTIMFNQRIIWEINYHYRLITFTFHIMFVDQISSCYIGTKAAVSVCFAFEVAENSETFYYIYVYNIISLNLLTVHILSN